LPPPIPVTAGSFVFNTEFDLVGGTQKVILEEGRGD